MMCVFFSLISFTEEIAVARLSYFRKCPCNLEFYWLWTSYRQCFPKCHV